MRSIVVAGVRRKRWAPSTMSLARHEQVRLLPAISAMCGAQGDLLIPPPRSGEERMRFTAFR